jgi:cytochrome c oxidase cbb3-type subunit 3
MGPSLRDEAWMYGGEPARVFSSIAEGRSNGMPAWGSKLAENQVWKLATYVKSLRTQQEPEPPE